MAIDDLAGDDALEDAVEVAGDGSHPGPPAVSDQTVRRLVAAIDRAGFAVLRNYFARAELAKLQAFVRATVREAGGEYTVLNGREAVGGTLLAELPTRPEFNSLLRRLYEGATGRRAPNQAIYQILRCLAGESSRKESLIFHYDSYVVTLLAPILIPTQGRRGHLVIAPSRRRVRPAYILNLLDKVVVDNALTQAALRWLYGSGWLRLKRIEMSPGDLYMFWGYRTLHTNEPCDAENIRATALFHFGDPHAASPLRRALGRMVV